MSVYMQVNTNESKTGASLGGRFCRGDEACDEVSIRSIGRKF